MKLNTNIKNELDEKSVFKNVFVYFLGIVLINISNFILIPIYTRYLPAAEYGILELVHMVIEITSIIFSAGIGVACISLYSKERGKKEKNAIISTGMITTCAFSALGYIILFTLSDQINNYFFKDNIYTEYLRVGGILFICQLLSSVPLAYIQAEVKSKLYISISFIQANVTMGLNIIILVFLNKGIMGILWSTALCSLFFSISLLVYTIRKTGFQFNWFQFKDIALFGLPFIPGGLFMFILNSADRFFIQKVMNASILGIYAVGYKFGMIVGMFVLGPFLRLWTPLMFKLDNDSNKDAFGRYFLYLISIYCTCALFVSMYSEEIVTLLTGREYWRAYQVIPVITLAYVFWTAAAFFDSGFYITKKTYFKPFIMGAAAAMVFLLYWIMIPEFGMMGAAYARAISFGIFGYLTYYFSQRIYPIKYPVKKFYFMLSAAALIYAVSLQLPEQLGLLRIIFKSILFIIFPALLLKFRIIDRTIIDGLLAKVKSYSLRLIYLPFLHK